MHENIVMEKWSWKGFSDTPYNIAGNHSSNDREGLLCLHLTVRLSSPFLLFSCQTPFFPFQQIRAESFWAPLLWWWHPLFPQDFLSATADATRRESNFFLGIADRKRLISLANSYANLSPVYIMGSLAVFMQQPATVSVVQRRPSSRIIYTSPFSLLIFTSAITSPLHPQPKMICRS